MTAVPADEDLARALADAAASATVLPPPSAQQPGFTLADGYSVGRVLHRSHLSSGATQVGMKLGFTNRAVWSVFGLDQPFWAPVYDDTVTTDPVVALGGLVAPRIEPEIVVGVGRDIAPGASADEVDAALEWAAAGFEIVRCHYPDWVMTPADALADAGLHGRLVVGERTALVPGRAGALADTEVELQRGDEPMATGRGTEALDGPLAALCWLLRLPGVEGLAAGTLVTTGTLTAPFVVEPGETWRLRCHGPVPLAGVEVVFH